MLINVMLIKKHVYSGYLYKIKLYSIEHVLLQLEPVAATRSRNLFSANQGLKTVYLYIELRFRDVTLGTPSMPTFAHISANGR